MAKRKKSKRIRKEDKKIENIKTGIDLSSSIYSIAGILLFIFAFYMLTLYITNKNTEKVSTNKEVEISNEKILVGSILSMSNDEYLVLCYDFKNESDTYDNIYTTAKSKGMKIYKVDLSSAFNKKYVTTEESNMYPQNESEFLINGATLIKVNNKQVVEYIEGYDEINDYLS